MITLIDMLTQKGGKSHRVSSLDRELQLTNENIVAKPQNDSPCYIIYFCTCTHVYNNCNNNSNEGYQFESERDMEGAGGRRGKRESDVTTL